MDHFLGFLIDFGIGIVVGTALADAYSMWRVHHMLNKDRDKAVKVASDAVKAHYHVKKRQENG